MHLIILFVNELPDSTVMCQVDLEKVKGNYNFDSKMLSFSRGHYQTSSL